jgi:hypothetical protein
MKKGKVVIPLTATAHGFGRRSQKECSQSPTQSAMAGSNQQVIQ